jgi:hypothetical protein
MTAAKTLTLKNKIKFSTKDLITTYQWSLAPLAICSTLAHFSLQANLSQPITLVATAAISLAAWISTCWIGKNPIKTEIKNLLTKT